MITMHIQIRCFYFKIPGFNIQKHSVTNETFTTLILRISIFSLNVLYLIVIVNQNYMGQPACHQISENAFNFSNKIIDNN